MSLAEIYLAERGLPLSIAEVNGIEIDLHPDRAKIEQRLGGWLRAAVEVRHGDPLVPIIHKQGSQQPLVDRPWITHR